MTSDLVSFQPKYTVRAGSVAVAGHALDCAECAGMRRVRWNAPNALECADCDGMRWKAPIAPNCANLRRLRQLVRRLRQLRRLAPIASFAPNCAVCAVCAELRRLRWNSAYSLAQSECYPVAVEAWCSLLAAVREINNAGQTLNDCYCLPFSCFFWRKTTNLASIDVLLCAHPEFCAHFGTVFGFVKYNTYQSYAHRFDGSNSFLF